MNNNNKNISVKLTENSTQNPSESRHKNKKRIEKEKTAKDDIKTDNDSIGKK